MAASDRALDRRRQEGGDPVAGEVEPAHRRPGLRTIRLSGRWGVPGADSSGSTTGLSADGGTLVLEQVTSNYPVRTTRLLELGTRRRGLCPDMWLLII